MDTQRAFFQQKENKFSIVFVLSSMRFITCFFLVLSLHLNHFMVSAIPLCQEEESTALLHFKNSLFINKTACMYNPYAFPKVDSWSLASRRGGDCCSWNGVQCDNATSRVIGLDLSSSCLYGSINSSSSLFQLNHLQSLNLAFNNFNNSPIPLALGRLLRLTHLNLSSSSFCGQIPPQVLELTKLVSLDLSLNPSTSLQNPGLRSLVQNLTSLKELDLSYVSIQSVVPDNLANLSSLRSLRLTQCGLRGEFPQNIFFLPNLEHLYLPLNPNLRGSLPEFHRGSNVKSLVLYGTSFSGKLPSSIDNLGSLSFMNVQDCNFSGTVPISMANLTRLTYLSLANNTFNSWRFPSWLSKLSHLFHLDLSSTNLHGEMPSTLANLTHLQHLDLRSNELDGQLPSWVANLTHLVDLDLSTNNLQGPIPDSIYDLRFLQYLQLGANNLSGTVNFNMFMENKNLLALYLSHNQISVLFDAITNATSSPKMKELGLNSCNISKFPDILRDQNELELLDLSMNNLEGLIPSWFLGTSIETLAFIKLSRNLLTGFEQKLILLPWKRLEFISLSLNRMKGSLPIPPPTTNCYDMSNNYFTGSLPSAFCSMTSFYILDSADNNLSGTIPPCFGDLSSSLTTLKLNNNNFHGILPQAFRSDCRLKEINLSKNRLQGQLPRSLGKCARLEILEVGNNQLNDTFPSWLATLQELKILVLRSNQFHGTLGSAHGATDFSKLQIIDLSCNGFFGSIPTEFFQTWKAMKVPERNNSAYLMEKIRISGYSYESRYSIRVTNKGVEMTYLKILDKLAIINLASNRIEGRIPESLVKLKGLHSLNLSNNHFTGCIPPMFGNLTELESLDLSHNKLSGQIPAQLTQLNFLELLNISYNNLSGLIPHGKQLDSFQNISYLGNPELCGSPLSKSCAENPTKLPSSSTLSPEIDIDAGSATKFIWLVISMGYLSGLVIGLVIGCTLTARKHEWFVETLGC